MPALLIICTVHISTKLVHFQFKMYLIKNLSIKTSFCRKHPFSIKCHPIPKKKVFWQLKLHFYIGVLGRKKNGKENTFHC